MLGAQSGVAERVGGAGALVARAPAMPVGRVPTSRGEVRGRVLDAGGERPLPAASLRIEGGGDVRTATSLLDGAFSFVGLVPGRYELVVARASYRPTRLGIVVPDGAPLIVDVQLTRLPVPLARVLVQAVVDSAVDAGSVAPPRTATLADSRRTPRPFDLLASQGSALGALVGGTSGRRPTDPGNDRDGRTLFIWGARDVGARVLLDGVALGAPLHLGGLLPVVDEQLLAPARMWTGGAPARFDGGTDYVLDLSTRPSTDDSLRAWATVDLLTERVGAELPLGGRGSLLAGVRRVNEGALARSAGGEPGYRYGDALARLELTPAPGHVVRATVLATREGIGIPRDLGRDEAQWGNRAAVVAWERTGGSERSLVRGGVTGAAVDLPLLTLLDGQLHADAVRASLLAEQRWSSARSETSVGVEGERLDVQRTVDGIPATIPTAAPGEPTCPGTGSCLLPGSVARVTGTTAALYADHRHALSPGVQLAVGMRASVTPGAEGGERLQLLPRLGLEALPFAGTSVRLSAGRFSRIGTFFDGTGSGGPAPALGSAVLPADPGAWMSRATATQVEAGASQRWRGSVLGLVAYWQRPGLTPPGQAVSHHRGVDVSWLYTRGAASLTASYSRILRRFDTAPGDSTTVADARRRIEQLASLRGAVRAGRWEGSLAASYAHGLSFASVVLDRPSTASLTPPKLGTTISAAGGATVPAQSSYLRVDAMLRARLCLGGERCRVVLAPYARLLNALDRRDAIFYYSDAPGGGANRLAGIPAIATIGTQVDFARPRLRPRP